MALNNRRRTPRHFDLGLADPPIVVPDTVYAEALEKTRRSLIGRILCPRRQDIYPMMYEFPHEWGIDESRCRGRIIGDRKFQFLFETERDLELVLWSGPYTFNGWLIVLQRFEDEQGPDFLQSVPMWVSIRGIPIQYLCEGTIREIVKSMGEVMEVELEDSRVDLSSVRARVEISVNTRICFKKVVRFGSRETKVVSLRYEDIGGSVARFKYCRNCGALNHFTNSCSHVWVDVPDHNDPSLSPPLHDSSSDDSVENNGGDGDGTSSSDDLEELVDAVGDGEQQQQGLVGVEEADITQVQSEMVGTSSEGFKRKFEAVEEEEEEADDVPEKRIRGTADATEGLVDNIKPLQEE